MEHENYNYDYSLICFYGTSTIIGYLIPDQFLYMYIKYIWFSLVDFHGLSTIVGYLMPNPFLFYLEQFSLANSFLNIKQFYFKQFSLTYKSSSISNNSV